MASSQNGRIGMNTERPTPETDAAIKAACGQWTFELRERMRTLERERDEAFGKTLNLW